MSLYSYTFFSYSGVVIRQKEKLFFARQMFISISFYNTDIRSILALLMIIQADWVGHCLFG